MKKDINPEKVTDVAVAIVPEKDNLGNELWSSYLINLKKEPINTVLVSTKGYGALNGKDVKTSILRHMLGDIGPMTYKKIEPLHEKLIKISNEFWVSFWHQGQLFDKKYVFVTESIVKENLVYIPQLDRKGVMIV